MDWKHSRILLLSVLIATAVPAVASLRRAPPATNLPNTPSTEMSHDLGNTSDNPITGRFEGSIILSQTRQEFDEISFPKGPVTGAFGGAHFESKDLLTAEGRLTRTLYVVQAGHSTFEVSENYRNLLIKNGFSIVYECKGTDCGWGFASIRHSKSPVRAPNLPFGRSGMVSAAFEEVSDPRYFLAQKTETSGQQTFVAIQVALNHTVGRGEWLGYLDGRAIAMVEVVEPRAMEDSIVTVGASEIGAHLQTEGRVAFYGIFFDFDKSELKPESGPQIAEMAAFMRSQPNIQAFIVGHTDSQGALDYNVGLSQRRAEAVVRELTQKQGIQSQRLQARGVGQLAPLASNSDEVGRAKNRRVEMVQR